MGNAQVTKHSVNEILREGNHHSPYYPFNDDQSKEIYLLYREARTSKVAQEGERLFNTNVLQIELLGYYHGDIVAFRFKSSHRPFIMFEYKNGDFQRMLKVLKTSHDNGRSSSKYQNISDLLAISYVTLDGSDFLFVTGVEMRVLHREYW